MGANDKTSRRSVQKQRGTRSFRKDNFAGQRRNEIQEKPGDLLKFICCEKFDEPDHQHLWLPERYYIEV